MRYATKFNEIFCKAAENLFQLTTLPEWKKRGNKCVSPYHLDGERDKQGKEILAYFPSSGTFYDVSRGEKKKLQHLYAEKHGLIYENDKNRVWEEMAAACGVALPDDWQQDYEKRRQRMEENKTISDRLRGNLWQPVGAAVREYLKEGRKWAKDKIEYLNQREGAFVGVLDADTLKTLQEADSEKYGVFSSLNLSEFVAYIDTDNEGAVSFIKLRSVKNGFKMNQKGETTPFNASNAYPDGNDVIFVAEGEATALSMVFAGFPNTIATRGAGNVEKEEFKDFVRSCRGSRFVAMLDNDDTARRDVFKLARTIHECGGYCYVCDQWQQDTPKHFDFDDLLSKTDHGAEELRRMIAKAVSFSQYAMQAQAVKYNTAETAVERDKVRAETVAMIATDGSRDRREQMCNTFASATNDNGNIIAAVEIEHRRLKKDTNKANKKKREEQCDTLKREAGTDNFLPLLCDIKAEAQRSSLLDVPEYLRDYTGAGEFFGNISHNPAFDIRLPYELKQDGQNFPITLAAACVTVFAAFTGHGKTAMIQNIAHRLLKMGKRVAYYSIEESQEVTITGLLNIEIAAALPEWDGRLSEDCNNVQAINTALYNVQAGRTIYDTTPKAFNNVADNQQTAAASAILGFFTDYVGHTPATRQLFIYDGLATAEAVRRQINEDVEALQPDVYLLDYVQLLQATDRDSSNAVEDMQKVMKILLNVAKTTGKPVVLAAQLKEKNSSDQRKIDVHPNKMNNTDVLGASAITQNAAAVYVMANGTRTDEDSMVCGEQFGGQPLLYIKQTKARFGGNNAEGVFAFNGGRRLLGVENLAKRNTPSDSSSNSGKRGSGSGSSNGNGTTPRSGAQSLQMPKQDENGVYNFD